MAQVYPRVCGGTAHVRGFRTAAHGLSPRVRGNPVDACRHSVQYGSIPACAGEPAKSPTARRPFTVYPRVCGGTEYDADVGTSTEGLSPRVRGNHRVLVYRVKRDGSIPACAGEP